MDESKGPLGHIAALATVTIWGGSFLAIVTLLNDFSPFEIIFFRFLLATAMLYLIYPKPMGKLTRKQHLTFAGAGFAGVTVYFLMQDFALIHTQASNVGVIVAVSPMFTGLLAWMLRRSGRPSGWFFLGFFVAICGISAIRFSEQTLSINALGDFLAVLAALSWAVYCMFTERISGFGYHTIQTTRRIFLYGLAFLTPTMLLSDFSFDISRFATVPNIASILFLGIGPSALCFVFWNFAVKRLGPVKTTLYIYLVPLITVVVAVSFLDEVLSTVQIIGIALAISGLLISNIKSKAPTTKTLEG